MRECVSSVLCTRAGENAGEVEVRDALIAKANYYLDIGDSEASVAALAAAEAKTAGAGQKLDLVFAGLR